MTVHVDKLQQRVNDIGDLSCRFKLSFIIHYKLRAEMCNNRRLKDGSERPEVTNRPPETTLITPVRERLTDTTLIWRGCWWGGMIKGVVTRDSGLAGDVIVLCSVIV